MAFVQVVCAWLHHGLQKVRPLLQCPLQFATRLLSERSRNDGPCVGASPTKQTILR